jgi:ribonuclease P protein component
MFTLYSLDVSKYIGAPRFGIVLTTRFSKSAVLRNRVKRIYREVLRLNLESFPAGYWFVIYPTKLSIGKSYEDINAEFNKVLSEISFSS